MQSFLKSRLAPFRSVSFRQFFFVQNISLTGLWAFDMARAWIVVDGLGQAGALGMVLMVGAIPPLFFSLYAGVLVDRLDVRRLVIFTKFALALLSILLAFIVEFNQVEIWHLAVFTFLIGCVNAFDGPTFHSLTVRLVPKEDFQQAISLNSTNFHLARALGPVIAGILMALHGPSWVFLYDGITYLILIFMLRKIEFRSVRPENHEPSERVFKALIKGLKYFFNQRALRFQIMQLFTAQMILLPLLFVVLRAYIKQKYTLDSDHFAFIFSFPAIGSATGAIAFALYLPKIPTRGLIFGIPLAVLSLALIPQAPTALAAGLIMTVTGFSLYLCLASLTVALNMGVEESYRGRLGSVLTLGFFSVGPLMSYPIGAFADRFGYEPSIYLFATIFAVVSAILFVSNRCLTNKT